MPRIAASTDGTTTTIIATIHNRPVLVRETKRQNPFLVISLPAVSARVHGQAVKVAQEIKVVGASSDLARARQLAHQHHGFVLRREGHNYVHV